MNILFVTHENLIYGASRSLLDIIDILTKKHKVFALLSQSNSPLHDELEKRNVVIKVLPYGRWCVKSPTIWSKIKHTTKYILYIRERNIRTAKMMAKFVDDNDIQIIHSNSSVVNLGGLIKKYSKKNPSHVWHIREFADLDFDMHPLIPKLFYFKFMNKYTDRFICISEAISKHYNKLLSPKKTIIYNGIGASNFIEADSRETIVSAKEINFLIAGRISKEKGQKDAILACVSLLEKGITSFHLYLAGSGNLYFQIPEQLNSYVSILGPVSDMPELRRKMNVELVCSTSEAFGRVTAEAMSAGNPVIGSESGGTPELIHDMENGILYRPGDVADLSNKMQLLIEDRELLYKLGLHARSYAMSNFKIERCVDEIEQVYMNITNHYN